jgi:endonuclease G, mitochondrial
LIFLPIFVFKYTAMAKFRTNHGRSASGAASMLSRMGIFSLIVAGLLYLYSLFTKEFPALANEIQTATVDQPDWLPQGSDGQLVHFSHYTLQYNEEHEQANWVAYRLDAQQLQGPGFPREDNFLPDPRILTGSATPDDYRRSGYDRGHLVPAADMSFDQQALAETFFMSNISPQNRAFNQGIWRELEEDVRRWVEEKGHLYIVSGPVLSKKPIDVIGKGSRVSVPAAYFKVLFYEEGDNSVAIGFLIPNELSEQPLSAYALSVDAVEASLGYDFFNGLLPDRKEEAVERKMQLDRWSLNPQKYQLRLNRWNRVGR